MSQADPTPRTRRLDLRHATILGVLAILLVPGLLALKTYQDRRGKARMLDEANRRLESKQPQLALGYLDRYLELNPNDVEALDLKAKVLAEGVQNIHQALQAIQVHNQVLGRDPDGPGRMETRRRLLALHLRIPEHAQASVEAARALIRRGARDAAVHRQLAQALEATAANGDAEALDEAVREYETAERQEPGDIEGAERLARLYRDKLNDPAKALQVLDQVVALNRGTPAKLAAAHLARARYFGAIGRTDRAGDEVRLAIEADPTNVEVRLMAAEAETHRGDTVAARRHLDAIPASARDDLRIMLIRGLVELEEQHPDEAIQSWRLGLLQTGGNNVELTWRLAHVLLELDRVAEANPLIAQYRRLVGGDEPNPRYRYLEGFSLLKKRRIAEAVAELEAIRYKVDKPLEPHLQYLLAQCYEAARDEGKAIDAYRKASELLPRWNAPWLAIARLQLEERPEDAYATLEQGLSAIPDDPRILSAMAQVLWREQVRRPADRRTWAEFDRVVGRAGRVSPGSPELALVRADQLMALDRPDEALAVLEDASKSNPRSVALWQARANGLARLGRLPAALGLIDRATAAIGPHAGLIATRALVLSTQGHVNAARAALSEGLSRVPVEQRPLLWKTLGELAGGQGDATGARQAYREWARLQPDNPEPRMALLDLALASGDDLAIRAEVEAMKAVGGPQGPYWRLARVQELLRDGPGEPPDAARDARRLDEAARLIAEVQANQPRWPLGYLLEGRLRERRGEVDQAAAAYQRAIDLKAGGLALGPLLELLIRNGRDAELERLRRKIATLPPELERLAAVKTLSLGDKARAEQLAAEVVRGDPQGLGARAWQAQVLSALGKPKEAEASLRKLIDQRPEDPAPWMQLLSLQVGQRRTADAEATLRQMQARAKSDRPDLLWARCYRALGDDRRALAGFAAALGRWPDDLAVRTEAIAFYEQTGRRAEAEASLRRVRELDPKLGWATRKLATLLATHAGDRAAWEEALRLIGPEPRPDDVPDDVLARAGVYALGPEPAHRRRAIAIVEGLSGELPTSAPVHLLAARLLYAAGRIDPALAHAAKAAEGPDAPAEAVLLYAGILLATRDLDGAARQLDRLERIDPDGLPVAELRARVLAARGKAGEAAAGLESAFAARVNTPDGLAVGEKMIHLLLGLGAPEAAERVARQVGQLGTKGRCLRAEFLATHGHPDEAAELLREADREGDHLGAGGSALTLAGLPGADPRWLALADTALTAARKQDPRSFDAAQKLAFLRHLQGRHEEAAGLYESLKDLNPPGFMYLNNLAWTLAEDLGRPRDALARADEAIGRVGREPHLLDTRGVIETRLGRLDDAIRDLEAAAEGLPTGTVYFHLARAYRQKGAAPKFRECRDRARALALRPEQLQPRERAEWAEMQGGS